MFQRQKTGYRTQPLIIQEFITEIEQRVLIDWEEQVRPFLRHNRRGPERLYEQVQNLPIVPAEYNSIRRRLQAMLTLHDDDREPEFGWFLGSIGAGGFVHEHLDRSRFGRRHFRCNLFIQTPECGGEPIIEGIVQPFRERMLLCFFPDLQRHRSNVVAGLKRRIVCSFGYLIDINCDLNVADRLDTKFFSTLVGD